MLRLALSFVLLPVFIAPSSAQIVQLPGVIGQLLPVDSLAGGLGNTIVDNNGNLLIIETQYAYSQPPIVVPRVRTFPTPTTKITPVLSSGVLGAARTYAGVNLHVLGVGNWGVYALMTTISNEQDSRVIITRRLVVLNAGIDGAGLPANASTLISTDLPANFGSINVVRGANQDPDTLYIAAGSVLPVVLLPDSRYPPAPFGRRILIYKYAGGAQFTNVTVDLP
jgi:hypothetical protein